MKKNIISIVFLLIIINSSCQNKAQKFNQSNSDLPDSIISFFPMDRDQNLFLEHIFHATNAEKSDLPFFIENFSTTFLVEIYKCNDLKKKDSLINSWKRKSLALFLSDSNNYFIISSKKNLYELYDSLTIENVLIEYQNKNLVMSFHDLFKEVTLFYDSSTICGLPKGYEILILNSGNKYILLEKYKYEWSSLPKKIKHGYRSGIAYKNSEPHLIYWVFAW